MTGLKVRLFMKVFMLSLTGFLGSSCSFDMFSDFSVVSVNLPENGIIGTERQPVEIVFTKRANKNSAASSIHIETDTSGEINFVMNVDGRKVRLTPEEN